MSLRARSWSLAQGVALVVVEAARVAEGMAEATVEAGWVAQ